MTNFGHRVLGCAEAATPGAIRYYKLFRSMRPMEWFVWCITWFEIKRGLSWDTWYDEPNHNDHLVYDKPRCTEL